jgi:hypothetical protein
VKSGKRYFANDNISAFIEPGELEALLDEVAGKMQGVLESLVIDVDHDHNATQVRAVELFLDGRHDELSRELRQRLQRPLRSPEAINARLDAVEVFRGKPLSTNRMAANLFRAPWSPRPVPHNGSRLLLGSTPRAGLGSGHLPRGALSLLWLADAQPIAVG